MEHFKDLNNSNNNFLKLLDRDPAWRRGRENNQPPRFYSRNQNPNPCFSSLLLGNFLFDAHVLFYHRY